MSKNRSSKLFKVLNPSSKILFGLRILLKRLIPLTVISLWMHFSSIISSYCMLLFSQESLRITFITSSQLQIPCREQNIVTGYAAAEAMAQKWQKMLKIKIALISLSTKNVVCRNASYARPSVILMCCHAQVRQIEKDLCPLLPTGL